MQFTLIDTTNKHQFIFPIAPRNYSIVSGHKEISIESITLGQIVWGRGRSPEVIHLSGIWPGYKQTMPRNHYLEPARIDKIFRDQLEHRPFAKELRLIITDKDTKTDINLPVFLSSYESDAFGGDGTLSYEMVLKEYRAYRIRRFNTKKSKAADDGKRPVPPKSQTYTVKQGDNLWAITRKYIGNGARYMELYNLNKGTLRSKNPSLIYPGEKLKIPESWVK